jgi:leucyl aminopeptidase
MLISFAKPALPKTGAAVVPLFEDGDRKGAFAALDAASGGALSRAAKTAAFVGRKDQMVDVIAPAEVGLSRVILLGAGKAKDFGPLQAEAVGGAAIQRLFATREKAAALLLDGFAAEKLGADEIAARAAYGALLRGYRFDKYRTKLEKDQKLALEKLAVHTASTKAKSLFADFEKIAAGVFLTRDLVSEPPNVLYPESFAARARELESLGVKVTVLGEAQMKKLGMGALLGVGQGSARDSQLVALEWMGGRKGEAPVAFVGKGVTFDTGGISIKPAAGMEDMKWDMGGAGAVTGAIAALAGRKAKVNAVGVLGLVENMPDGNAQRPGDIVKTMSGQTVEIINTDAEGRLVLADAIWWTQEIYKPKAIVDLATLTGAIIVALANEYAGLFSKSDALCAELAKAGEATGELLWRMPLGKAHDDMIKSDVADMKNTGGRDGGSSSAAAFIGRFVKDGQAWAHLDIAGKAWATKDHPTAPKGGTGYGVRLLDEWVRANYEGK